MVIGFNYLDKEYFYERDLLGNIISIIDAYDVTVLKYEYTAFGIPTIIVPGNLDGNYQTLANKLKNLNIYLYKGYIYDVENKLYYCESRYYDPELGRWLSIDSYNYLDPSSANGSNLYAYCVNNPVMYFDPSGKFAISLTVLGLIVGAVIGATAGGIVAYNVAKDHGTEGWELIGWTTLGIVGGGIIGGALGAGAGALATKLTGIYGYSVTKYSIIPIKKITVLGHMPGYIGAAKATGAGYYLISDPLYESMTKTQQWANNLQYLKDAHKLGTQFVVAPDRVVSSVGTLWQEIQYLIEQGIAWIFG